MGVAEMFVLEQLRISWQSKGDRLWASVGYNGYCIQRARLRGANSNVFEGH